MKTFGYEQLKLALKKCDISTGTNVFIHSSLMSIGLMEGVPIRDQISTICSSLLDQVTCDGSIIVPTFNFSFARGQDYDLQNSVSENMGSISEYIRKHPRAKRSRHPLQSVAAIGPIGEELCLHDPLSGYGPKSPFDILIEKNATLLFFGTGLEVASLGHFVEEEVGVPYRYWKTFEGNYRDGAKVERKSYKMYVRDMNFNPKLDFSKMESFLDLNHNLKKASLGQGWIKSCTFQNFVTTFREKLIQDPNTFVV